MKRLLLQFLITSIVVIVTLGLFAALWLFVIFPVFSPGPQ